VKYIAYEENRGGDPAGNTEPSAIRGEHIQFLDIDDEFYEKNLNEEWANYKVINASFRSSIRSSSLSNRFTRNTNYMNEIIRDTVIRIFLIQHW
jgi:hypothetical protein